jgi:hypothetical protein
VGKGKDKLTLINEFSKQLNSQRSDLDILKQLNHVGNPSLNNLVEGS